MSGDRSSADQSVPPRIEVICATEVAAKREAEHRQAIEPEGSLFEWIYLRNEDGRWVARRTRRDGSDDKPSKRRLSLRGVADVVVDSFHPEDFFLR